MHNLPLQSQHIGTEILYTWNVVQANKSQGQYSKLKQFSTYSTFMLMPKQCLLKTAIYILNKERDMFAN